MAESSAHQLPASLIIKDINNTHGSRLQAGIFTELEDPLKHLPYASNAAFNAYDRQHDSTCLEGTRVAILQEIYQWVLGEDERCIFWLSGWAGTGKSAIARTVARHYEDDGRLAASFFFSRGGGDCSHTGLFVTSIAHQLAKCRSLDIQDDVRRSLKEHSQVASQTLQDQWTRLVLQPLSRRGNSGRRSVFVLVIDALDECENERSIGTLLQLLPRVSEIVGIRMRILVTSRPETPVRHGFKRICEGTHHDFVLHDISSVVINRDIQVFLEHRLSKFAAECYFPDDWPGARILERMVEHAGGLFIWAETACKFIEEDMFLAEERLDVLMNCSSDVVPEPQRHLDRIYATVLSASVPKSCSQLEQKRIYGHLRLILGSVTTLFSTLSADALSQMLDVPIKHLLRMFSRLHSILHIDENPAHPLRLHHDSFRNFLSDGTRCQDDRLFVDKKEAHAILATRCVEVMSAALKEDLCDQKTPAVLFCDVDTSLIQRYLPQQVQYACLYWVSHLVESGQQLIHNDKVHQFLRAHILHWIEAMSWSGKISEAIRAMASLEKTAESQPSVNHHALIYDAKRLLMYARSGIEKAPLQTYVSAAYFAPKTSSLRQYSVRTPSLNFVKTSPQVPDVWGATLHTLEGHSSEVRAVQFSPEGSKLVSASDDRTVRLWDVTTGAPLHTLKGHLDIVWAVQFSPNGSMLASGSEDRTLRVWDTNTGTPLRTLIGHSGAVRAVQFSPDGSKLASASGNRTVRVWDAKTGALLRSLEGHLSWVIAVRFSPDGSKLASASWDKTLRMWDVNTRAPLRTLKGHLGAVRAVQFSPEGSKLASASDDKTVRVWDTDAGTLLRTLKGHSDMVWAVQFSPDGSKLASASGDRTVRVWDANTATALHSLEGHFGAINAIQFSPDGSKLASASWDKTLRVWDANLGVPLHTLKGHSDMVWAVQFSPDGSTLASASGDRTVRVWDVNTVAALRSSEGHSDAIKNAQFSPDGSKLAPVSDDRTVQVQNANTAVPLRTLDHRWNKNWAVQLSPDGSRLASASWDITVRLWDINTGSLLRAFRGHSNIVWAVQFSPDGSKLASTSLDRTVRVWDANTGVSLCKLRGHSDMVWAVQFSPDGSKLASASGDRTVRVWDASTVAVSHSLEGHSGAITAVQFSPDGNKLASASRDKTLRVWDANTRTLLCTLKGHSSAVKVMQFSPDGSKLVSAADNRTVQMWDANTGAPLRRSEDYSDEVKDLCTKLLRGNSVVPIYDLYVEGEWVFRRGNRIIWLPLDQRPVANENHSRPNDFVVVGSRVVIRCASHRVSIWDIVGAGSYGRQHR